MPSKYWRRQVRKVTCTSRRERDYLPSRPLRSSAFPPALLCVHPLSLPCNTYIPPGDFVTYVNCFVVASGIKSSKQQTTFQISTESTLPSIPYRNYRHHESETKRPVETCYRKSLPRTMGGCLGRFYILRRRADQEGCMMHFRPRTSWKP